MIYQKIQLASPKNFISTYENSKIYGNILWVKPTVLSICAADQRYFWGERPPHILQKKLPMALIHEGIGEIFFDPNNQYSIGTPVILLPNRGSETSQKIYSEGAFFRSSNQDGFTQELMELIPSEVIPILSNSPKYFVFAEVISVCLHAISRIPKIKWKNAKKIAVWGDGIVGYLLSWCLRQTFPFLNITVFGRHEDKLMLFTHVDNVTITEATYQHFNFDIVFEAVGGKGSEAAISQILNICSPLAVICLLGVSEESILIDTRKILEKGLTIVGSSRSTKKDFEQAASLLEGCKEFSFLEKVISNEICVNNPKELCEAFEKDRTSPYKTLIHWNL